MNAVSEFPSALLTVEQVAERLSVSTRTVFRMAASGEFPSGFRVRNLRRWRSKDVDEAIARMASRPAR
ncbi:helix-turn-helix transcriptional regulator [Paludisphaera rhizosphaerae]|uniref:helix-turn-helix transcriptional regulator n=1 Tax=Paludisphaera rhizosphaerae TaxID=2711216 RepID=UPI0013EC7479|nr:helix-turn-helix domain-containing protein [Paludisphaera rhizosphaerae]